MGEAWLHEHSLKRSFPVRDVLDISVHVFRAVYFMVANLDKSSLQSPAPPVRFTVGDPECIFSLEADLVDL